MNHLKSKQKHVWVLIPLRRLNNVGSIWNDNLTENTLKRDLETTLFHARATLSYR